MYHVFCETLREAWVMSFLDKVPQRKGIKVRITARKALISHVKEGIVITFLDSFGNGLPLLLCGIDTSRVVCAGVKKYDAVLGHSLDVRDHAIEIKANCLRIVVPVFLNFQARVIEHSRMVGPARCWNVHCFGIRIEALEEGTADTQSPGT